MIKPTKELELLRRGGLVLSPAYDEIRKQWTLYMNIGFKRQRKDRFYAALTKSIKFQCEVQN